VSGKKPVTVELNNRTFELFFDLNALDLLETEIGKNPFDKETWDKPTPKVLRALVWAGLRRSAPDADLQKVGSWISLDNIIYVQERVGMAFEQAVGTVEQQVDPLPAQEVRS